jgi:hypothetical protein
MDIEVVKAIGLYIVMPICAAASFGVFVWSAFRSLRS